MPELPEIAAHAERLADAFGGVTLERFTPLHMTALKTFDPPPQQAAGRALSATGHRGKFLYLHFDPPEGPGDAAPQRLTFVVHLMKGGRLRPDETKSRKPRNAMARWTFSEGPALLLTEAGTEKRAGVWLIATDPETVQPVAGLGPDADTVSVHELAELLRAGNERVHGFLRRQGNLAGMGRLLANEICHTARISPFAGTAHLDDDAIGRLHAAIKQCIARGLAAERLRDDMGRSQDRPNDVHHRVGRPCRTCGDEIRAVEYRRYTVAYCASCQTGGKILADNTTSRFLR